MHTCAPPLAGWAIGFGKGVPFFLSPRGEEGAQRVSDGKVRGSFRRRVCFRKQREICAPPSPSHAFGAGPSLSPMGRGDIGASVKCNPPPQGGGAEHKMCACPSIAAAPILSECACRVSSRQDAHA